MKTQQEIEFELTSLRLKYQDLLFEESQVREGKNVNFFVRTISDIRSEEKSVGSWIKALRWALE